VAKARKAEAALKDFFREELEAARAGAREPDYGRLEPGAGRAGADERERPRRSRARSVLAELGFAACFLAASMAGLGWARAHPGALTRRLDEIERSGLMRETAEYVARGVERGMRYGTPGGTAVPRERM